MVRLLLVRHGNTFDIGDVVRRVGAQTDIPLSQSGAKQCLDLGRHLSKKYMTITHAFCSELMRTKQSAELILTQYSNSTCPITLLPLLNEVDYGIDDGKPETEVVERLGIDVLKAWDDHGILPNDWNFNVAKAIENIKTFADMLSKKYDNQTVLIVTSNGIARFFSKLLKDPICINKALPLKMPTASVSELTFHQEQGWQCQYWGERF